MSAPHPRYQDDTPSLKRVLAAFAPPPEALRMNGHPRNLDEPAGNGITPPSLDRLADLATLLRQLTWGEMDEFSSGIGADPKTIHQWSTK